MSKKTHSKPTGTSQIKPKNRTLSSKKRAKKKAVRARKPPLTVPAVKLLAFECDSIIAAGEKTQQQGLKSPLEQVLREYAGLDQAWKRGRFLRSLRLLAGELATVSQAAKQLGMAGTELRKLLDTDIDAGEIWNDAKRDKWIAVQRGVVNALEEGKITGPGAIKLVERFMDQELSVAQKPTDFHHITIEQMCIITGKTRVTIHEWYTKYGLRRNSDKTYDLSVFIQWFEEFTLNKRTPSSPTAVDPLRAKKVEQLNIDIARQRGELLDRQEVIAGIIARYQNLVNACGRKADELTALCVNQPARQIARVLEGFFEELRRAQCEIPEQLRLPAEAAAKLGELLESLQPEGLDRITG